MVTAAAAIASLLTAGPAQGEGMVPAEPNGLRVISWNICGDGGGKRDGSTAGYCPYRNEPWRKVDEVVALGPVRRIM